MNIAIETIVHARIDEVWEACTSPSGIVKWNAASDDWHATQASVALRVGGAFSSRMEARDGSFGFDFAGTYTAVIPNQRIEYPFGDRAARVDFAESADGVRVKSRVTPGRRIPLSSSEVAGRHPGQRQASW